MPSVLIKAKVTVGVDDAAKTYFFLTRPQLYLGDVSTATEIKEAAATEQDEPVSPIWQVLNTGKVVRVHFDYEEEVDGKKVIRTIKAVAKASKFSTLEDALKGKNVKVRTRGSNDFADRKIIDVYQPTRATRYA